MTKVKKITARQIINLAKKELKALRKHTTPIQKKRLEYEYLNMRKGNTCIYGQIANNPNLSNIKDGVQHCDRPEAINLIKKCVPAMMWVDDDDKCDKHKLNGALNLQLLSDGCTRCYYQVTPLEYIGLNLSEKEAHYYEEDIMFNFPAKDVISYIKGNTDELPEFSVKALDYEYENEYY